jgi:hypothetical protein
MQREKPESCTCQYPTVICRNMNGHAPDCPVYIAWANDMKNKASTQQPLPAPGKVDIWPLVVADIEARVEAGKQKYGTVLQSHNGRDPLWDAYQEAIDLAMYLRQAIAEKEGREVAMKDGSVGVNQAETAVPAS